MVATAAALDLDATTVSSGSLLSYDRPAGMELAQDPYFGAIRYLVPQLIQIPGHVVWEHISHEVDESLYRSLKSSLTFLD